jgi:magnesium transporter
MRTLPSFVVLWSKPSYIDGKGGGSRCCSLAAAAGRRAAVAGARSAATKAGSEGPRPMIIDCAHYHDGVRQDSGPLGIREAAARAAEEGSWVWLGLYEPTPEEMEEAKDAFHLHELAVEDAERAHQRAKLEDYEGGWFAVLKTAKYDEEEEIVEFGEIHLMIGSGFLIAVRHGTPGELKPARQRLEERPDLMVHGPVAAAWAILDKVVDDYEPVAAGIEDDIEEAEEQIFDDQTDATQRIYSLKREVIEFNRAVHPLLAPLEALERGSLADIDPHMGKYFRDVADHARRIDEQIQSQRELLTSVLEANLALITVRQNVVIRGISAWAAIIAVPTFIASVYGMNFQHMPELHQEAGYPIALLVMAIAVFFLHRFFRRIGWL